MKTQTSLVATQVRLSQWAEQIRDCQNRPGLRNFPNAETANQGPDPAPAS